VSYSAPKSVRQPTQVKNFYPRDPSRPRGGPQVLMVLHMTGNKNTASAPDGIQPGSGCYGEWKYAATSDAARDGPSAHDYVARNGEYIEMLDPATQVAWSNGDLISPQIQYPGVAYLKGLRDAGINANRGCYREIEMNAYPGTFPVTAKQRETAAYLIAKDSIKTGLPITAGKTVLVHAYINWINRQNCPFPPTTRNALLESVCARARVIKGLLLSAPATTTTNGVTLRYGGDDVGRGDYVAISLSKANVRAKPSTDGTVVRQLPLGSVFHVSQTTQTGQLIGGSKVWRGSPAGTEWVHDSQITPTVP
jgi:hypothetical protein